MNLTKFQCRLTRTLMFVVFLATPLPLLAGKVVFRDEFDGPKGSAIDASKWALEIGGSGWGNQELQYYTNSTHNAIIDGNGSLVITAVKLSLPSTLTCWYGPCEYTSARLKTKGKFELKFGRFEARIKVPKGNGVWPAFWLLGSNIDTAGWPACGEIDIMEHIGREPLTVYGTIHGPGYSGAKGLSSAYTLPNGQPIADGFHVFAVEWTQNRVRWFVDGVNYKTVTPDELPKRAKWAFDRPFFLILNFAVGGQWPGNPDSTTNFPQSMIVDYVRVYE